MDFSPSISCNPPDLAPGAMGLYRPRMQVRRAQRHESGFWVEPPAIERMRKPVIFANHGLEVRYGIGPNIIEEDPNVRFYEGAAHFVDVATGRVLGVVEFDVLQNPGDPLHDHDYLFVLDEHATSYDFGTTLTSCFSSLSHLFYSGRSAIKIERLEFLPNTRLKGRGMEIGLDFLELLDRKFDANVIIFEPYPLQYRTTCVGTEEPGEIRDEDGYAMDLAKLTARYKKHWGAASLGDHQHMFCTVYNEFTLLATTNRWQCTGPT